MSKHTPGPWDVDPHDVYDKWIGVGGDREVALVYNDDIDSDEAEANSRLIAAAPDLLLLVEELAKGPALHACDTRGERNDARNQWLLGLREKAKAAIAKATGESK